MTPRIIALVVVLGLVLVGAVAAVLTLGGDDEAAAPAGPTPDERETMTIEERARAHMDDLPDGEHQGRLITVDAATVTFRMVQVLSGPEALAAAQEDGLFMPDGTLPNDVYVRDTFQTLTLPIAEDVGIRIQSCANGCQEVDTSLGALIAGEAVPHGGDTPVFVFRVSDQTVVSMAEIYLP